MFGWNRKVRKLKREVDNNAKSILVIKECCKVMSDELEALKDYIANQQKEINELRELAEKAR